LNQKIVVRIHEPEPNQSKEGAMQTYTQCRLRRNRTEQIVWMPTEFAKKNSFVRIKDEDGWRVIGVGATKPAEFVTTHGHGRDHLRQRQASDI
jgi:hypothetical protein